MADINSILNYPDISFIDNVTQEQLESNMIQWFKEKRKEVTGKDISLGRADDRRLILSAAAYFIFQGYMYVDTAGRNGLLKYAQGKYLENLGAMKKITREGASGATTTVRFKMGSVRASVTPIPAGSRVTSGDSVYFATDEYAEIPIGKNYIDVTATCTTTGTIGNDYAVGELNVMVDPVPFIDLVWNTTAPEGGRDQESDDDLRARIYAAPDGFTTGGTTGAYEYIVRAFDPTVEDVLVTSPSPRIVHIAVLLTGGTIPGEEYLKELKNFVMDKTKKMLTDEVETVAPTQKTYAIDLTYYINLSDKVKAETIQKEVNAAIEDYKLWQRSKIGRDLNPNELTKRIVAAGAKRVEYRRPVFEKIAADAVAIPGTVNIVYGGMEDD